VRRGNVSPGAFADFAASHHLRQSLVFLNMRAMQQPEACIGNIDNESKGDTLTNESTRKFLQSFVDAFAMATLGLGPVRLLLGLDVEWINMELS
jgi:NAD(P)H-dependent FMN reductase